MRVGIIGAGGAAQHLHLPVLSNLSGVEVRWVCDTQEPRARKLAKLFSIDRYYRDMEECDEVDIALIAIPVGYRRAVMSQVFSRRWHVFCEKPVASSTIELDEYLQEARDKKVQIGVGLMRRFAGATVAAKGLIRSGCLGQVQRVWASEGRRTKRTGHDVSWYMADPGAVGGGALMETGAHLVDQVCTILEVHHFDLQRSIQVRHEGLDFHTQATGKITTGDGSHYDCVLEVSQLEDLCEGIFIQFDHCIIRCEPSCAGRLQMLSREGVHVATFATGNTPESFAYHCEWQEFLKQCMSGEPSDVDAQTVRISVKIIEDCYRNAQITPGGGHWRP